MGWKYISASATLTCVNILVIYAGYMSSPLLQLIAGNELMCLYKYVCSETNVKPYTAGG